MSSIANEQLILARLTDKGVDDVLKLFRALDWSDSSLTDSREALIEAIYGTHVAYGEAVTVTYVELIARLRAEAGLTDSWSPAAADAVALSEVESRVRWALDRLWDKRDKNGRLVSASRDAVESRLEAVTVDVIHRQGRETVGLTAEDKRSKCIGYARVLGIGENCEFCLMLSSRGPVYRSRETAGAGFHDRCRCTVVPHFRGTSIDGYDPDAVKDAWRRMVREREERQRESKKNS